MVPAPAPSDDGPSPEVVLEALDDEDCRTILQHTAEPMTATDLIDACDISQSTVYRKLDRLCAASLVREQDRINPNGGRVTLYERDFEDVTISMESDDTFAVTIDRPPRNAGERLADIWSKMGDEL